MKKLKMQGITSKNALSSKRMSAQEISDPNSKYNSFTLFRKLTINNSKGSLARSIS